MLRKIFKPKTCVWLIVALLMVSICFVPFTNTLFMGSPIPTGTLLVLLPILLGVVYAIVVSCEPVDKMTDKKKNGFAIGYAIMFVLFYVLDIAVIIYAVMNM